MIEAEGNKNLERGENIMAAQTLELMEDTTPELDDIDVDVTDLKDEGYDIDDELDGLSSDIDNWATDEDEGYYGGNSDRDYMWSLMR